MAGVRIAVLAASLVLLLPFGFLGVAGGQEVGPVQPIAFSHRRHTGENKIPCLYCHVYARRSSVAGIPAVARCMGCHKMTAADKPEVKKLSAYWDRKEPIPWRKVTWMPNFVYFEHWPHIRADISCQTCHGPVENMEQVWPAKALTMSFCVACHRQRRVSIDCTVCHR